MREAQDTPGYVAPLRGALTQVILFGGAPRSFAILNLTLGMVIVFSGALVAGLALGVLGHLAGVFLPRRDPQAMDVLARAIRIPPHLEI